MEKQKMTIHRGLTELKTIDDRVKKMITDFQPLGLYASDNLVNGQHQISTFNDHVKAKKQAIDDLIDRKIAIKKAVVAKNAKTKVTIAGNEMTVADAITYKSIVELQKLFLKKLQSEYNGVVGHMHTHNASVEEKALRLAESALQKDNVKITDKDAMAVIEPYLDKNKVKLADPLQAEKEIEKLEEKINSFLTEVDSVLSESNAVTFIEL